MLLRPEYLSQTRDRPLPTKDGGVLRTIRDACDYMTNMDKKRELHSHWQRVCKLILGPVRSAQQLGLRATDRRGGGFPLSVRHGRGRQTEG
jgi:hypothetical protein